MLRSSFAAVVALSAGAVSPASGLAAPVAAQGLAPHRAIYDIQLKEASDQSGIESMRGRMVYEFNGSQCTGYTTSFRFVTEIESGDEVSVTDQQITTFEDLVTRRFDFDSKSYTDDKLDKGVRGVAAVAGRGIKVELKEPASRNVELADAKFPAEHMVDLIGQARKGARFFEARIFDGTEDGDKSYLTTTIVGRSEAAKGGDRAGIVEKALAEASYWPVSIAYFDDKAIGDQLPVYTQSFKLYDNGVTRDLTLDYGDIVLSGRLAKLEMLEVAGCK